MLIDPAQLDELFAAALAETTPGSRAAFLDQVCADNSELRKRLESLLAAHDATDNFLNLPGLDEATVQIAQLSERPGTTIGPYKLLQQIGEGGMGVVFMAEQTEPIQRTVALKIIKPGMDTRQVIARFEAERQALSLMDHPNIARVLNAGTTAPAGSGYPGRSYFVMELVKGVPITKYCDDHHLTPRERLELFLPVCQAVQHAHQKGIIHRDLKPSNVMIALYDGRPVPKIIDFGVAKATGSKLTDRTLITEFGAILGTLEYMSPEQAELNQLDVDTRSDIYSLGVLLYELLTGSTPLERKRMKATALHEALRVIREEEPPKPSTRLSSSDALPSIAAYRGLEPLKLNRLVRGELDWIVMKALEKDRNRRYETANSFAADVQRYLADEAVQACPPSAGYRLRKFVRRNKAGVLLASGLATLLIAAVVILVVSSSQIRRESAVKELALQQKDVALQEKSVALGERDQALSVARENESLASRRYYAAQMNLASQAWHNEQQARTVQLLETLRPGSDEPDLRGFEWYHMFWLSHPNLVHRWRAHPMAVMDLAWSPDGALLASGDWHSVRLWDGRTGEFLSELSTGTRGVWDLDFSRDGQTLAGAGSSGEVVLWDVATRGIRRRWMAHPESSDGDGIRAVAVSPDGKLVATSAAAQAGDAVKLWNTDNGQLLANLGGQTDGIGAIAFSPDGTFLVTAAFPWHHDTKSIAIWDLKPTPTMRFETEQVGAEDLAFSADGRTIWAASGGGKSKDQVVQEIDVPTGKIRRTLRGHRSAVRALALSADEKQLYSCAEDHDTRVWDVGTGTSRVFAADITSYGAVAADPKGQLVAIGNNDGWVTLHKIKAPEVVRTFHSPSLVSAIAFTPDNQSLIVGGEDVHEDVQLFDVALQSQRKLAAQGRLLAVSPDCELLAQYDEKSLLSIWNVAKQKTVFAINLGVIDRATFSADGKLLATWAPYTEDITFKLWSMETGQEIDRISLVDKNGRALDEEAPLAVVFSPDGRHLAVSPQFRNVGIYDYAEKSPIEYIAIADGLDGATTLAYSPDGSLLAAGLELGEVVLLDVAKDTGRLSVRSRLQGHTRKITTLAFSPDGQILATGGKDATLRLWDVATGQERITFEMGAWQLAFSPDGTMLAAVAGVDGKETLRLWVAADDPIAKARRTWRNLADVNSPGVLVDDAAEALNAGDRETAQKKIAAALQALEQETRPIDYYTARVFSSIALLRWKLADRDGYHDICRALLRKPQSTSGGLASYWIGWTCGLIPAAVDNYSMPLQLARQLVADAPQNADFTRTLGALLYRKGAYAEAVARFDESLRLIQRRRSNEPTALCSRLFLAMAKWRLGHADEARRMLTDLQPEIEQVLASSALWYQIAAIELLRDEAVALIMPKRQPADVAASTAQGVRNVGE